MIIPINVMYLNFKSSWLVYMSLSVNNKKKLLIVSFRGGLGSQAHLVCLVKMALM